MMHKPLKNLHILVGICGGIAAYKSAELVRLLVKAGADVRVVMTLAASQFITPLTLQALSGSEVRSELFDTTQENAMGHIELARWADFILVAPATASFMARLRVGMANDLLTTLCLATEAKILLAPAMNRVMWLAIATQENRSVLEQRGIECWGPDEGEQACGEVGAGRMLEPLNLCQRLERLYTSVKDTDPDLSAANSLSRVKVLITAGPTRENIDPVRFIGNRSSGKMGFAMAQAAQKRGAQVTLIAGPVTLETPHGIARINVESAVQMHQSVMDQVSSCDLFIGAAAVADYRVVNPSQQKIKKADAQTLNLQLQLNPDILAEVALLDHPPFTVGFAAETQHLEQNGREKLQRKKLDMVIANLVGKSRGGFECSENSVSLLWTDGSQHFPMQDKVQLANELLKVIAQHYHK